MINFITWIFVCFMSTFGISFMFYNFNDGSKIDFKVIIIFIIGVIMQTVIQYYDITLLSSISYFVFFPILFISINDIIRKRLIFFVIIIWFYGVILDILMTFIASFVFSHLEINYIDYSYLTSIILAFCLFVFMIIFGKSKTINKFTNFIYEKLSNIKYTDIGLLFLVLFIICIDIVMVLNIDNLSINFLLVLVAILTIIFFIILFKYQLDAREIDEYLKILRENNEFYIRVDDDNRIFKHNLTAKLSSIKSVGNKRTNSLIDDLILQFNKSIDFSSSIKVIPYGLNGIIYQKLYSYLDDLNVKINNEINYDFLAVLKPRRYNVFVEKMMLALDNAIESCLKSKEKALVINIFDDEVNIYVEVENTFASDIDLDLLGTKSYSTKGKRRGLGLFSMFRNNEAKVTVKIINNLFVNKITTKKRLND